MYPYTQKEIDRVFSKIEKTPTEKGCLLWTGGKNKMGYGMVNIRGKTKKAHRTIWEIFHGRPIKKGMCICHNCDVPGCCNPDHLYEGTHQDNMNDMFRRNRQNKVSGELHGRSKLKDEDILKIRELNASGTNTYKLAEMFGTGPAKISEIVTGKAWKTVGGPIRKSTRRIAFSVVEQIRAFWEDADYPIKQKELAEIFDVSRRHIRDIINYKKRISK